MVSMTHESLRRRIPAGLIGLFVLVLSGCPLEDPGPPYTVLVHAYQESGGYALSEVELPTLHSLQGLEGEFTRVIGGVDIAIDAFATADTEEELVAAIRVRGGNPVDPRWYLRDGVVVPEDFGSLLLFSYYAHMERCRDFFHTHGLPDELPGHIPTFHMPTMGTPMIGGFQLIKDNAAYSPTFGAFALFPRQLLMDQLPLAMNLGVVCHEYSHAVFHSVVAGDSLVPAGTLAGWPNRAANLIRSVDEGMADVFGALVTADPDFIGQSISEDFGVDRDLAAPRRIDDAMTLHLDEALFYNPYPLGSVIASVLWSTREEIGGQALGNSAVRALYEIAKVAGPRLDIEAVSEALFQAMEEAGRPRLCEAMLEAEMPSPLGCEVEG